MPFSLQSATGVRLGYANGPLNVAAAYGIVRGGTAATGVDYKTMNLGASYKFGALTPMVLVASDRGNNKRVDMYSVGVKVPVGAGELRAAYSWFKDKKVNDADSQRLALGYGYKLSKRTEIYAAVARMSNIRIAKIAVAIYVEYHQNVPMLVQVFLWYFGIPALLPLPWQQWINAHNSAFVLAFIAA